MILDISICVVYLLVVLALGVWFARQQHDNEDYFVGGRRMHWLPIGLSIFAGTFSALSFVGLPREAAYDDYQFFIATVPTFCVGALASLLRPPPPAKKTSGLVLGELE